MKLKKQNPEKQKRKSDIAYMALVATMVNNIIDRNNGVCGVHPYLERRKTVLHYKPGILLQPWQFMELFGEDTNYEYLEDWDGDKTLYTEVNGAVFYAPISGMDEIAEGRLV